MKIFQRILFVLFAGMATVHAQDTHGDVLHSGQAESIIHDIVNDHELMLKLIAAIKENDHATMMIEHLLGGGGGPDNGHDASRMGGAEPNPAASAGKSPYAGEESRSIKALSDDDIRKYSNGEGMGLAKTAELNGYPGPKHLLELGDTLGLSGAQKTKLQGEFDRMHRKAVELGKQIVEKETYLDKLFAERTITPKNLQEATRELGRLNGELRATHLSAHLSTPGILTDEQVGRYTALRGYSGMDHSRHK